MLDNSKKDYDLVECEEELEEEEEPTDEELQSIAEENNTNEEDTDNTEQTSFDESDIGRYLKDIASVPLCKPEEEIKYFEKIKAGDETAKNEFIEKNLRLVVSVANRHVGRGLAILDLIQEGNIGLIKSIDKFDPEKGFKFSTYATWWIRQSITRAIAEQSRAIRIPVHMVESINKCKKIYAYYSQEYGRKPTREEIAQKLVISLEKAGEIEKLMLDIVSLYTPVGEDENTMLLDFVPSEEVSTEKAVEKKELANIVGDLLSTLPARESKVVALRYGIGYERDYTLEEIGSMLGVTRERIRQIEAKALRKIKMRAIRAVGGTHASELLC